MKIRIKYVGTDENNVTVNSIYTVLGVVTTTGGEASAVIVNDLGEPRVTKTISDTSRWRLVSVETEVGKPEQIYP